MSFISVCPDDCWHNASKKITDLISARSSFVYGSGSSVGIATGHGLDGPRIESGGGEIFRTPVCTGRGDYLVSRTMYTGSFPVVKSGRGVTLTPHPLLVPCSTNSRAIPVLPLWAVRPVQSLSACTVQLYLYFPYWPYGLYRVSVPEQGCTFRKHAPTEMKFSLQLHVAKVWSRGKWRRVVW